MSSPKRVSAASRRSWVAIHPARHGCESLPQQTDGMPDRAIRVLLVDDRPAVRLGLRLRLGIESDLCVVGEAAEGRAAIELVGTLRPDAVVMDVAMLGMDGLAATEVLRRIAPRVRVIVLSLHDDRQTRAQAALSGAAEVVSKHESSQALIDAIRRVANLKDERSSELA